MERACLGRGGIFDRVAQFESPYSASGVEICDLIIAAAVGPGAFSKCVRRLRGIEIALPNPAGYVLFVGGEEDTILTPRDYEYWTQHPFMRGAVCVIGTLGYRHTLVWDRRVVASNGVGQICVYDMGPVCFVSRVADNFVEFLAHGLPDEYVFERGDDVRGRDPSASPGAPRVVTPPSPSLPSAAAAASATSASSSFPPGPSQEDIRRPRDSTPSYTSPRCAPVDFEGVVRVGVPSERLLRGIRLVEEDFNDELFKSVGVASAP